MVTNDYFVYNLLINIEGQLEREGKKRTLFFACFDNDKITVKYNRILGGV